MILIPYIVIISLFFFCNVSLFPVTIWMTKITFSNYLLYLGVQIHYHLPYCICIYVDTLPCTHLK